MKELTFRTDKPIMYYDRVLGGSIRVTADFKVAADTDDESCERMIPLYAAMALYDVFGEYGRTVPYKELSEKYADISAAVSEKLTEKANCSCRAELTALTPDEVSAKFLEDMALMEKMKDPAFAAAEMERALKQAQETAEKNGMSLSDIQNMKMPDLPPIPDDPDPIARAQAISDHMKMLGQTANKEVFDGRIGDHEPRVIGPEDPLFKVASAAPRPKFCMNCGHKLPESGNFCPDCGTKIG